MYASAGASSPVRPPRLSSGSARRRLWTPARVREPAVLCYYNRTIIGTDTRRYTCVCMHARTKYTPTAVVRAPSRCKDRQLN